VMQRVAVRCVSHLKQVREARTGKSEGGGPKEGEREKREGGGERGGLKST